MVDCGTRIEKGTPKSEIRNSKSEIQSADVFGAQSRQRRDLRATSSPLPRKEDGKNEDAPRNFPS
jgi:hypothetical protein